MGGGPSRATVVVDTGSGPVWSACISFSGTISGVQALELAGSTITDLAPVYESYSGEGRAVCALRGVGTAPPGCLGNQANYWAYFRNGAYARGGASASKVRDGDVEGWRWGTGVAPRAATAGTRAVATPPATTSPPPPAPVPSPTVAPPTASPTSAGGPAGGLAGVPAEAGPSTPTGSSETVGAGAPDASTAASSTTAAPAEPASSGPDGSQGTRSESTTGTAAASPEGSVASGAGTGGEASKAIDGPDRPSGPSSRASAIGFGLAIAVVAIAGLVARRRRLGGSPDS